MEKKRKKGIWREREREREREGYWERERDWENRKKRLRENIRKLY